MKTVKHGDEPRRDGNGEGVVKSGGGTPTIVPCRQVFDPKDQVGTL